MKTIAATRISFAMLICVSAAFSQSTQVRGVYLPAPPRGGAEIVEAGAKRFLGEGVAKFEVREPLRIYNGGPLKSLALGRLDATETSEYFYGVFLSGLPMGWARVRVDAGGAGQLLSVTSNAPDSRGTVPVLPLAASVDSSLKQLAVNEHLRSAPCEARLLSIIGTTGGGPYYVLWLKPPAGDDWIYTLDQRFKPADVENGHLYSTAEFMKLIQPAAQQRLEQNPLQTPAPGRALPGA